MTLTLENLKNRPQVKQPSIADCAGNGRSFTHPRSIYVPSFQEAIGVFEYTGTPLKPILEEAGLLDDAVEIVFTGHDAGIDLGVHHHFERALPVDEAMLDGVILAWEANGQPLPPAHGFPLRLVVPTWYGMTSVDRQAHVTGSTQSPDFPTRNALEPALGNHACTSDLPEELCDDGFVTKFDSSGQEPVYSTYLAGRAEDKGLSIDVSRKGQALVGGRTDSRDFPVTTGAPQKKFGGYIDGFAMKLRPGGSRISSSFFGGKDADRVTGISADRRGAAHLTGRTLSPNFPTARPFAAVPEGPGLRRVPQREQVAVVPPTDGQKGGVVRSFADPPM